MYFAAPNIVSDDIFAVWRIDDADHSFFTHPFKIKYARQDVPLSIMVSFNFATGKYEVGIIFSDSLEVRSVCLHFDTFVL